jgi:hypothetical protein
MAIMTAYNKSIIAKATAKPLFEHVLVHFGLPQTIILEQDNILLSTLCFILWLLLETKLTKSIPFHPHIDGQIEVVNRMILHLLDMYKSKHPCTGDEILPYIQHIYKLSLHSSNSHIYFQVGRGFQPLGPIDVALPLASTHVEYSHAQYEGNKATKFIEKIQHIYQQVHDILKKSNANYKEFHDQHRVPHKFQVGDKVWLHFHKQCLTRPHRNL